MFAKRTRLRKSLVHKKGTTQMKPKTIRFKQPVVDYIADNGIPITVTSQEEPSCDDENLAEKNRDDPSKEEPKSTGATESLSNEVAALCNQINLDTAYIEGLISKIEGLEDQLKSVNRIARLMLTKGL